MTFVFASDISQVLDVALEQKEKLNHKEESDGGEERPRKRKGEKAVAKA
jgi:hypothetical protein